MKRLFMLLLVLAMALSLCACGNGNSTTENNEPVASTETNEQTAVEQTETTENTDTIIAQSLGDTVSTDIIDLTVKKAALAFYAEGATHTSDGKVTNIDTACEPAENGGLYSCNKGHALVCLDFVIKNNDRAKLDTRDLIVSFTVRQGDNENMVFGYDPNSPSGKGGLNLYLMPIASNGGDFIICKSSNKLISAGEELEIKWVGIVSFEPDDVNGSFDLVAEVKNSSGYDKFTYLIGG